MANTTTNGGNQSESSCKLPSAATSCKLNSSSSQPKVTPPVVLWAQRADKVFLTLQIQDCQNPEIKLEKEKLYFKGKSYSIQDDADHGEHEVTIEFFKSINADESKSSIGARGIDFIISKEEPEWWPRLLKDSTKQHWLKVDFLKWKDEDDTDDEMAGGDAGFGGFGGGMGGMGGQPDFSELMQQFGGGMGAPGEDEEDESEDDETDQNLPDLEEHQT